MVINQNNASTIRNKSWLYAKVDGAEIIKKGRFSKTKPGEPVVYQWDDIRGPPTHWKPILGPR